MKRAAQRLRTEEGYSAWSGTAKPAADEPPETGSQRPDHSDPSPRDGSTAPPPRSPGARDRDNAPENDIGQRGG